MNSSSLPLKKTVYNHKIYMLKWQFLTNQIGQVSLVCISNWETKYPMLSGSLSILLSQKGKIRGRHI